MRPDLIVEGADVLVTPEGVSASCEAVLRRIENPVVACEGGRIAWAGPRESAPESVLDARCARLDAGGGTLLPGFIDPHTHAVFAGWRADEFAQRLRGARYAEIAAGGGGIVKTMAATREASAETLERLLAGRLSAMLRQGVTTVEVKSGYGLDVETEVRQLRAVRAAARAFEGRVVATFMGAHAVPPDRRADREGYLRTVIDEALPIVADEGLAAACDVFCDDGAFTVCESRAVLEAARSRGLMLKVHADELGSSGGAELAGEVRAVSAEHLLHASDAGIAALARSGTVAVLLPATSFQLRETPAAAARFRERGCAMAVGTDFNPGSSPCDSLTLAAAIGCVANGLTPDEALTAITLNAAAALGLAADAGSVEAGKSADLVVIDAPSHEHLFYRFGGRLVKHIVARGRVVP